MIASPEPAKTRATICIGTITRNRPQMVKALLKSYERMQVPAHVDVVFCIVENAPRPTLSRDVADFAKTMGYDRVTYFCEPRLGIPFARNAVLDFALMSECDYLTFVDDDEVVDTRWLLQLYSAMQQCKLDLVGGPVRLKPVSGDLTRLQKLIWKGLKLRLQRKEKKALKLWYRNQDNRITIITSSFMAKLSFVRKKNLRFDTTIGLQCGSDVKFDHDARRAGAITGWAPRAYVYETIPEKRLSLTYQFCRGRDQAIARQNRLSQEPVLGKTLCSWCSPLLRLVTSLAMLVVVPFAPAEALLSATRGFGVSLGQIIGILGGRSEHYRENTGE